MKPPLGRTGFTLIELTIVVAIIGILAAIAIPEFSDSIARSQEGVTKGNLGTIRTAVSVYYGDTEGQYPADISVLTTGGKYLTQIPVTYYPSHP